MPLYPSMPEHLWHLLVLAYQRNNRKMQMTNNCQQCRSLRIEQEAIMYDAIIKARSALSIAEKALKTIHEINAKNSREENNGLPVFHP